ncbi:MAG: chorismate synthase [Bacteroidales bacterium]|nr:chorismate synthase [Bacteroidales bacterium]
MRNTFGNILSITTFGESHGAAIGGVIDGFPAGVKIDFDEIQRQVARRRPGQSAITTARNESDTVEVLSGVFEGVTLGTPIGFIIRNTNHHSSDYSDIAKCYRPSHADYTYQSKYGIRDYRGGGRSSARETAARVVAGAFAMQALQQLGIQLTAYTSQVSNIAVEGSYESLDLSAVDNNIARCPDEPKAQEMIAAITEAKSKGDTLGGVVTCVIKGVPVGLGEPVFSRLNAQLAAAMMSINAAKGVEFGLGFDFVNYRGSDVVDRFVNEGGKVTTATNYSGGIQGGISNGEDIYFNVAFKPVATLLQDVDTVDMDGNPTVLHAKGRHDPCVVPRAVPIVEAMAALVILDNYLLNRTSKL